MKVEETAGGFEMIYHRSKVTEPNKLLVQTTSPVKDFEPMDTFYLWVGHNRLNKEEVVDLIRHLQSWVETGSLDNTR